jgi:hypothetical protein
VTTIQEEKRKSLLDDDRVLAQEIDEIAAIENDLVLETARNGRRKIKDEEDRGRDREAAVPLNPISRSISTTSKRMKK